MKKYLAAILVAVLVTFSAPAFAVTNPFMDVPLGHWAYDAVAQLAARGIISGFPDGMYRGAQPTTRFEMASVIARTLAVIDMTKASRQDVEMLMRLVVEFKDELDALGVRVDQLGSRVDALHNRLGGWRLSGWLRADLESWRRNNMSTEQGVFASSSGASAQWNFHRVRLNIERWFGANEDIYFRAELRNENQPLATAGAGHVQLARFWVDFPWFFDVMTTVGRFYWDWEGRYSFATGGVSGMVTAPWFAGVNDGMGFTRNFAMGRFQMYAARNVANPAAGYPAPVAPVVPVFNPWWMGLRFDVNFTEQFAFDIGLHHRTTDRGSDNLNETTLFAGASFSFTPDVTLSGIYYHQIQNQGRDNVNAFRLNANISQNMLGFSSLWLGFDQVDDGFMTRGTWASQMFLGLDQAGDTKMTGGRAWDGFNRMRAYRLGATQQWNADWRTWLYVAQNDFTGTDARALQWALGIEYRLNPNVGFALSYVNTDWRNNAFNWMDNHVVRFTTSVTF